MAAINDYLNVTILTQGCINQHSKNNIQWKDSF